MAVGVERNLALRRALVRALAGILLVVVVTTVVLNIREGVPFFRALLMVSLMLAGNSSLLELSERETTTQVVVTVVAYARIVIVAIVVSSAMDFILRNRFPMLFPRRSKKMKNHVIVVGLGQVGFRVLDELRQFDVDVVVVEENADGPFVSFLADEGIPALFEDARNPEVLVKAGLEDARALIACTDMDLTNVEIALDAREIRPDIRIVLRLFDQRLAAKITKGFDIQLAFSAASLAAPAFAAAAVDPTVRNSFYVADRLYVFADFWVPAGSSIQQHTIWDVWNQYTVNTLSFTDAKGNVEFDPGQSSTYPAGTKVGVVGPYERVLELQVTHGIVEPADNVARVAVGRDQGSRADRYEPPSTFIDPGR
jgi:voltage-gated potassium channel Kch